VLKQYTDNNKTLKKLQQILKTTSVGSFSTQIISCMGLFHTVYIKHCFQLHNPNILHTVSKKNDAGRTL